MTNITTFEFTPFTIGDYLFNIPIYQRLYAWEEAEIRQLLEDLYRQFEKDRSSTYYLGNLVLYKNGRYDVIDGQQRLTTLFLIGLVFKESYKDWSKFLQKEEKEEKETRLAFVAREDDNAFLEAKLKGEEAKTSENLNAMMTNAISVIELFIAEKFKTDQEKLQKQCFFDYVFQKTTMVGIIIPEGIDLNKYFEDMNNRGVQLEKHEILKAKLLSKITDEKEHTFYARLWDACSQMNQYVEYGFDKTLQKIRECLTKDDLISALKTELGNENDKKESTLLSILEPIKKENNEGEDDAKNQERQILAEKNVADLAEKQKNPEKFSNKVGSIINFPTFILHCYKIWKGADKGADIKLSDKDLLEVFNEDTLKDFKAKEFIDFLFACRVLYDAFFIKSIESNDGKTTWEINNISKTSKKDKPNEYERDDDKLKETAVIQAMLNASTSMENWFTPALKYVLCAKTSKVDAVFCSFLERLDTELAKERMRENNLKEITDAFLRDFDYKTESKKCYSCAKWLIQHLHKGTGTPRYWFFRLDYYLRKEWIKEGVVHPKMVDIWKIKNYQFRQNRSVEHIYPQNPESGERWADKDLHNFGNLALISISSNSSYKNQEFRKKEVDFKARTQKWGIESLKQLAIFEHEEWTAEKAQEHGKEMIVILIQSLQQLH